VDSAQAEVQRAGELARKDEQEAHARSLDNAIKQARAQVASLSKREREREKEKESERVKQTCAIRQGPAGLRQTPNSEP